MTRQTAMSEYTLDFTTIDGEQHRHVWQDWPLRFLHTAGRPHTQMGVQYRENCELVFIPWHQITKSTLKEVELWNDGDE